MDVTSTSGVGGNLPVRPIEPAATTPTSSTGISGLESPQDEVEISNAARMLERVQDDPRIRSEHLDAIQAQIAAGSYETPDKLEAAIERLLDEIG